VDISRLFLSLEHLISVLVLKVHDGIGTTNAMKNLVGIAPGMVYGSYHYGLDAFDHWVAELEAGRFGRGFGLGLTAGVAVGRREHAGQYLREVAVHFPEEVAGRLLEAFTGLEGGRHPPVH